MVRALIIKFGAIGDVLMAVPAVYALHQQGTQIDWVCGQAVAPLLALYPWINPILADDRAILTGSTAARAKALLTLWKTLAGRRYALCATLYYDSRYKLLTLPVRAHRKVMLSRFDRATRLIPSRHHADEYARVLLNRPDGEHVSSLPPLRPLTLLPDPLGPRTAPYRIALVPASANNMLRQLTLRRWPAENYAELARAVLARGWEVVLLGGPDDAWVRPQFAGLNVIDKIGAFTLPQVISACDACDAVISHDTGPMHIAGLSRAAIIALFGPTDPANFIPRRPGVLGIWGGEGFACRPCYDGRDFPACSNNGCMQQITPQMVMSELDKLLAAPTQPVRIITPSAASTPARNHGALL
jgi:heptosyltransferase-2